MAERTKRGDEERKREDRETTPGEPAAAPPGSAGKTGKPPANTTRDKSAKPAKDISGDDDAAQKS